LIRTCGADFLWPTTDPADSHTVFGWFGPAVSIGTKRKGTALVAERGSAKPEYSGRDDSTSGSEPLHKTTD